MITVKCSACGKKLNVAEEWTKAATGYNFIHDLGPANFPTGGKIGQQARCPACGNTITLATSGCTSAGRTSSTTTPSKN